jgi:RimJ/RimL family protein N-acetyltransferase
MKDFPELKTERLYLRSFHTEDRDRVLELAGQKEIAAMTLSIPHPLKPKEVEEWLKDRKNHFEKDVGVVWAICEKEEGRAGTLVGAMGLRKDERNNSGEIGFWIGKPYWGRGYATEAGRKVIGYAFSEMELNRVEAKHFVENRASNRVLEKLGMQYEGLHRQAIQKWDRYLDVKRYAILRSDDGKGEM